MLVVLDASEALRIEKQKQEVFYIPYMYVKGDRDLYLMDKSYI